MIQAELKIKGLVQGVFFRAEACDAAALFNITGRIKNMPDGTVQAIAIGEEQNIKHFIEWCKHGPPGARVDQVEIQITKKPEYKYSDFSIL